MFVQFEANCIAEECFSMVHLRSERGATCSPVYKIGIYRVIQEEFLLNHPVCIFHLGESSTYMSIQSISLTVSYCSIAA